MATSIKIIKLKHAFDLHLPSYATAQSAGLDLTAANNENLTIKPGEKVIVPTGIAVALPVGFEAQIRSRSGLSAKFGITVLNSPGTIDADYRGEIQVLLINHGKEDFIIKRGMRIAQMIIAKYEIISFEEVESLDETFRSSGGFGSTGH